MRRQLLAFGAVIALALAGVAWLLSRPSATAALARDGTTGTSIAHGAGGSRAAAAVPNGSSELGERAVVPDDSELGSADARAEHLRVLVVDATTRQPIAGARVLLQHEQVDRLAWREAHARYSDVEPMLASGFADEYRTDERGCVFVREPLRPLWITADRGELHGERRTGDDDPCVVEVRAYHALDIEVVDANGAPASGVRMALIEDDFGEWWSPCSVITDQAGRARIEMLEDKPDEPIGPLAVGPAQAFSRPRQIDFTLDDVPSEPLRFVLEPTGSVELCMSDAQGRPIAREGTLSLRVLGDELPRAFDASWTADLPAREGRAVFAQVGLGLQFEARAEVEGWQFNAREFAGPRTAGERVAILVPRRAIGSLVRGRAVTPDGEPLRYCGFEGRLVEAAPNAERFELRASTDGRGEFALGSERPASAWRNARLELLARRPGEPLRRCELAIAAGTSDFEVLVGDAVFESLGERVRGRVVDANDKPVAGARIEALDTATRQPPWGGDWGVAIVTDEHGQFAIAGTPSGRVLELRALAFGYTHGPRVRVADGTRDVVLRVARGGGILGRVLVPSGFDASELDLDFEYVLTQESGRQSLGHWTQYFDGTFEVEAADAGTVRMTVSHADRVLATREGIEVRLGETTRVGDIDVRDRLFLIVLTLVDEAGQPLGQGEVSWSTPGSEDWQADAISRSGRARLHVPNATVTAEVSSPGFCTRLFEGVRDGDRLVLQRGRAVELRFPRNLPPIEAPFSLRITWQSHDGAGPDDGLIVDDAGRVTVYLGESSNCDLRWFVTDERTGMAFCAEKGELAPIVVGDAGLPATIEVALERESLLEALARARGEL